MNIKKIRGYDPSNCQFGISFDASFMMEREDIRKTLTQGYTFTPKNTKEEIVWIFSCDSSYIKQQWVNALSKLK